jgi:hypothetical protein
MTPTQISIVPSWNAATIMLGDAGGTSLEPGSGPVVSLYFTLNDVSALGTVPIDLGGYSVFHVEFTSQGGAYVPFVSNGEITVTCCKGRVGDVNGDGGFLPTIGDISLLIDFLFMSRAPLGCYAEADANQSGGADAGPEDITIGDVSRLIDNLFVSRTPLPDCL